MKQFLYFLLPALIVSAQTKSEPPLSDHLIEKKAFKSGLTNLYINAYDGEHQIPKYEKLIEVSKIDKKNFFIRPSD